MTKTIRAGLVGMHFHPPAKLVLEALPAGCQLVLVPQPENPYDAKAIKVLVAPGAIPASQHGALANALPGSGMTLEQLLTCGTQDAGESFGPDDPLIWLGFVADSDGKMCIKGKLPGNREVGQLMLDSGHRATLGFDGEGRPQVVVEVPG